MSEVRVDRLHATYRLPASRPAERARLDQLLDQMVRSALEPALGEIGVGPAEEVCIRSVFVPVRLRLGALDAALVASWSRAISEAVRRAVETGADWVVRYRSPIYALADMANGAASGDLSRAWAWRQLGLWRAAGASAEVAAGELARALAAAPTTIVPVLEVVERQGRLERLVCRADARTWTALAAAALAAAGVPPEWAAVPAGPGILSSLAVEERAERVVRRSVLASALAVLARRSNGPIGAAAAAAFTVLESDPGSLRGSSALPILAAVQHLMSAASAATRTFEAAEQAAPSEREPDSPVSLGGTTRGPSAEDYRPRGSRPGPLGAPRRPPRAAGVGRSDRPGGAERMPPAAADERRPEAMSPAGTSDDDLAPPVGPHPAAGWTRAGGLPFLLHLVRHLRLVDRLADVPALQRRPVRWVLHDLALDLLPLEPDDPAALAFAGLAPDARPPRWEEEPPTPEAVAAIHDLAGAVGHALVELLERPGEPPGLVVEEVCRRRAEIVADPGWIEVRMSLDEVSLEARQAGLDLDLGYVPWLGVVVRFVYA